MPGPIRSASPYVVAALVPLALGEWVPVQTKPIAASVFFLCIAVSARFFGAGVAMVCLASSTWVFWNLVLTTTAHPWSVQLTRLMLFLTSAIVVASLSRQRAMEVGEAEKRYRNVVELSPDGICVIDDGGRLLFANPALASLVGASDAEQLVGHDPLEFVRPESQARARSRMTALLAGRRVEAFDELWTRLDGNTISVEVKAVPTDLHGKRAGQLFVRDVTDRKAAEAKAEESTKRLQALFETALDGIVFVGAERRFIDANPAASTLLGYTREELIGRCLDDCSPASDEQKTFDALSNRAETEGTASGEAVIARKDGSTREIEYRSVANLLPGVQFVMMHDITARKDAERSLHRVSGRLLHLQDDERRRIARQLHDTTAQSLAAISLNLFRISRSPAAAHGAVKEAVDESVVLTDQSIAEIRTLSYLLHPPMIDEAGLLPSLRWYVRGFEQRSGIKTLIEAPEEIDRLPRELETAVFRIVQEALTNVHRHSGSEVATIVLDRLPRELRLEVRDEGRGLRQELRGDSNAIVASGIGIAGILERVRLLDGDARLESNENGLRVIVTIPLSPAEETEA